MTYKSNFPPVGEPPEEIPDNAKKIWEQVVATNPHLTEADKQELKRFCISSDAYEMYTDLTIDYHNKVKELDDWSDRKEILLQLKAISSHVGVLDRAINMLTTNLALATTPRDKFTVAAPDNEEDPDERFFNR